MIKRKIKKLFFKRNKDKKYKIVKYNKMYIIILDAIPHDAIVVYEDEIKRYGLENAFKLAYERWL